MKISGFSMVKNAEKLYYPVREMILSALPLVDEFVIAIGDCEPDDNTRALVSSIKDPKVMIVDTEWNLAKYPRGMENAHQTDIAKSHCSGDWLLYLQADEVIHEEDIPKIREACEALLHDPHIEGLLFKYRHFWGDYDHFHYSHSWYKKEIRVVRNDPEIHSWESAQSFRRIPGFDGVNYRQQEGTFKLHVAEIDAWIYHYGWVRPPILMQKKTKALDTIHKGAEKVQEMAQKSHYDFDYGPLSRLTSFAGTHPAVMKEWIAKFNWKDELQYTGSVPEYRRKHKHEKLKYRLLTWLENHLLGGRTVGGFRNYVKIKKHP
jgi:glycosyltransferase involved in cell wall biosynthesis